MAKERKEKSRSVTSEDNEDQVNGDDDEEDQNESMEQNGFSSDHEANSDTKERLSIVTLVSTNKA